MLLAVSMRPGSGMADASSEFALQHYIHGTGTVFGFLLVPSVAAGVVVREKKRHLIGWKRHEYLLF